MEEAKNEYLIKFGPYEVELKGSQVYFRKNGSLMKAMPVKSTFGLYDLKKLVQQVAKKVNMTSKLPKDVLKANKNESMGGLLGMEAEDEEETKILKDKDMNNEKLEQARALIRKMVSELMDESDAGTVVAGEEDQINESDYVVIDPRGNARPAGNKIQASQYVKKMGGGKKGYYMVLKKNALKARRAIEKAGGNYNSPKVKEKMSDLYWEGRNINEMNERDLLKLAVKGAFKARIGTHAAKEYLKSLQNSWRINKDWKEYKDWKVDDFEEDAQNWLNDKR